MDKRKYAFHFFAFCTAAVWGTTFVSSKVLIVGHGLTPAAVFFLRFVLAYLGLWIICLLPKTREKVFCKSPLDEFLLLLLGITGGSFYFLAENSALKYTEASNVAFILCTSPIITYLMTFAARKMKVLGLSGGQEHYEITGNVIVGTILAILGVAAVIFNGAAIHLSPAGDFLALAAALLWGIYSVIMGVVGEKYSAIFITRKIFFYGIITILPFILAEGLPSIGTLSSPVVIFNLVFLGLVASLLGFIAWNKAIHEIGNVSATNYLYFSPFFTLVLASAVLGEMLTILSALGSILIFIGVFLAGKKGNG